jgi:hypothetical protein
MSKWAAPGSLILKTLKSSVQERLPFVFMPDKIAGAVFTGYVKMPVDIPPAQAVPFA